MFGAVAALLLISSVASAGPVAHIPGHLLVKPKSKSDEKNVQDLFAGHGAAQVRAIHQINVRVLRVPEARLESVLSALRHNSSIEFAETDDVVEPAVVPNDPYYSIQWHLPKIQAPQAWDLTTGANNVIIAILDSGLDANHPDLEAQLVAGWNWYDNNSDTSDVTGHGTPVAGTAAGCGNNGMGIAPLAWGCKIMPVRISDTNGYASLSTIASGLTWAADQGARVANISYRASSGSTITSAAQYFQNKGGVVTVSSGNNGTFDSSADNPYLLTVSATDENDLLTPWSNTGNNVDLAAPGVNVMTTAEGGDYGSGSGTSFSAPIVAGVAALVISANPALTGAQIQDILKQTADDLGAPGWDTSYGFGRVNAYRAVRAALEAAVADTTPPLATVTSPAPNATLSGTVSVNVDASDDIGVTNVEWYLDGTLTGTSASAPAAFSWDTTKVANGSHALLAKAYDGAGNIGTSASVIVSIQNAVLDTTAPTVRITSPSSGTSVSKSVNVSVSSTDDVGVTRVELYTDGKLYASSSSPAPTFIWSASKVAKGQHTLQAFAYDKAGNKGFSATVTVYSGTPAAKPRNGVTAR